MHDTTSTSMLIVGAGPFALSAAALAREHGIDTITVGRPMGFWREHMPDGLLLRSGPDWHLDATGEHTLRAYLDERRLGTDEVAPIPVAVFLGYADWFRDAKQIEVREEFVTDITRHDGGFEAECSGGGRVHSDVVVAAPGVGYFGSLPDWAAEVVPGRAAHSVDLISFDALSGRRVLIVGGRQSAYEWAALISEHGAERVDVVHRHPVPRFEAVNWDFFDDYVESTLRVDGWWRRLAPTEQAAVRERCRQAGRATLEPWLPPRLSSPAVHVWPRCQVAHVDGDARGGCPRITLSNSETLQVDHIVFATGYAPDLARVPYLAGLLDRIATRNGFPVLDEGFQSTVPGLYLTGFTATQDFGPFFGFVKAAPVSSTVLLRALESR
ncbi:NAD(P)-binding domain-containing protein [Streptomyces carpinensis]|uniref:NAD(P)-binding domain-containing protein n=1 Tax=Streptomyces carpinensis TaxID=66369 RepID=A0ABV1W2N4_9ACTN|nr:NAD(P)-binding domain-containing protein [Streptomyces carpinensis]